MFFINFSALKHRIFDSENRDNVTSKTTGGAFSLLWLFFFLSCSSLRKETFVSLFDAAFVLIALPNRISQRGRQGNPGKIRHEQIRGGAIDRIERVHAKADVRQQNGDFSSRLEEKVDDEFEKDRIDFTNPN